MCDPTQVEVTSVHSGNECKALEVTPGYIFVMGHAIPVGSMNEVEVGEIVHALKMFWEAASRGVEDA